MAPTKAAQAITGLDEQLAADLLANMKVKAAAKILDQISKQKATELSTTFSTLQLE
jgi:flagellar motility protein MotE (MotC chaperone)